MGFVASLRPKSPQKALPIVLRVCVRYLSDFPIPNRRTGEGDGRELSKQQQPKVGDKSDGAICGCGLARFSRIVCARFFFRGQIGTNWGRWKIWWGDAVGGSVAQVDLILPTTATTTTTDWHTNWDEIGWGMDFGINGFTLGKSLFWGVFVKGLWVVLKWNRSGQHCAVVLNRKWRKSSVTFYIV